MAGSRSARGSNNTARYVVALVLDAQRRCADSSDARLASGAGACFEPGAEGALKPLAPESDLRFRAAARVTFLGAQEKQPKEAHPRLAQEELESTATARSQASTILVLRWLLLTPIFPSIVVWCGLFLAPS